MGLRRATADPEDAARTEANLFDAFAAGNLADTELGDVECRRSSCRLEVSFAGAFPEELRELEVARALASALGGAVRIASEEEGQGRQVIYATRTEW